MQQTIYPDECLPYMDWLIHIREERTFAQARISAHIFGKAVQDYNQIQKFKK